MNIWYISKYTATPETNHFSRQYMIAKQLVSKGQDVSLIYSRSSGKKSSAFLGVSTTTEFDGVHCIKLNGPLIHHGFNLKRIISWLLFEFILFFKMFFACSRKKPDYIIASSLSLLTFFTAVILKKRWRCKLILEVRDIWPDTIVESGQFSNRNIFIRILRRIELFGYKHADGIFSPLPRLDIYLKNRIKYPFNFVSIPQGFDPQLISLTFTERYKDIFVDDRFTVCYAGSIGKLDYIDLLLEAADLIGERNNIKFVIMGDGTLKNCFREKYEGKSNVLFLDPVPKREVISIISKADLLVNVWGDKAIYQYGVSPNKWIDYMLSGRPVLVAYNGYRCIINEANCGFFIETNKPEILANKIKEISSMDKDVLNQLGQNGKNYALKNLNYDVLTDKLLDFIRSV